MGKNIVLVGLMGAGKSSVGQYLAQKLNMDYIDTDTIIEEQENCTINEIFAKRGENVFRELESQVILNLSLCDDKIISTGGGSLEKEINLVNLQRNGFLIYLKTSPEILYSRIKNENNRPLLKTTNPLEKLKELLKKREKNYLKANFIIQTDTKTQENIANEIIEGYNEYCKC